MLNFKRRLHAPSIKNKYKTYMIMIRIKGIEALPQVINEEDGKVDYVETKPIKISDLSSAGSL